MSDESVLIVEDDPTLLRVLKDNFESRDFRVYTAVDGEEGLEAVRRHEPALILLDIMLPRINGYEVCRLVRRDGSKAIIIMLTAKGLETDIVLGLNLGADDYVTKPFSIQELLARANAFLRRRRLDENEVHKFGPFELDLRSHKLLRGGEEIPLTPKEYGLLAFFVRRAGRALTRDDILNTVWGDGIFVTHRSVDRCVTCLRKKIEPDPQRPVYIHTIREVGYRFEPESRASAESDAI
ncbi:MAG: DNA-binding response regulator [Phycisphaerae bacterium]